MCLGVPGRIVEIADATEQRAVAEVEGVRREVSVALLGIRGEDGEVVAVGSSDTTGAVGIGDWVLIHVGFAMSRIDEAEAAETMRALKMFTDAFDSEMEEFGAAGGELDPLAALGPLRPVPPAEPDR